MSIDVNAYGSFETIDCEADGAWLTVWFNQPEKRNPLSDQMVAELKTLCEKLSADPHCRGLTLRGRGGFFCAGGDLAGFKRMASAPRDEVIALSTNAASLFAAVRALPQVTIALIEGAAMAGGLGLACCCDVAMGLNSARFAFSETQIGITPAQIARYVLLKTGFATGRRLMVTAARFDGAGALGYGLLDVAADALEELEHHERGVRADTFRCAPGAIAATKRLLDTLPELPASDIAAYAAANFTDCFMSDEGREGIASFMEKRKPVWFQEI